MPKVLIVDDEESICWGLSKLCGQMNLDFETAASAEAGLELSEKSGFDLVIMDVRLPGMDGISAIKEFRQKLGNVPIITITAFGDLKTAIDVVQQGAFEYIVKPFELEKVRQIVKQAITTSELVSNEFATSPSDEPKLSGFGLIGDSPLMQEVFKQIALTTTSDAPVLLTGESGTGKEVSARMIHRFSSRNDGPFVAVNIASLSPSLAESELFGHVQGAFTDANSDRKGLVEQAHGGTLFLDEVAETPLEIQVKLLRVLDQGEVTPVGSNVPIKTNFRLISATHQDLLSQINHGEFRHDLFYRLRTFEIRLPPLRERKSDLESLVNHFLNQRNSKTPVSFTPGFLSALNSRRWDGNVRELQSVVERAATTARGGLITEEFLEEEPSSTFEVQDLDSKIQSLISEWTRQNWMTGTGESLYEELVKLIDPAVFSTAYELSEQKYSAAARRLGIHRTTLKKKLDEL